MKLRIERDVLAEAITWAARSLPARAPMPVLAGLLLDATPDDGPMAGGTVTVSVFDYEVSGRVDAPADVVTPGRVLASGRMLADIIKALPAKPVDLIVDGVKLRLVCGASKFTLLTMPVDEYPTLPSLPAGSGTVDGGVLAAAVAQVAPAASKDGSTPILTTVRVAVDAGRLTLLATDRYRAAISTVAWRPDDEHASGEALVLARSLADVARTLSGGTDVTVALSPDLVGFQVGARRSTTRLIDGQYPDVLKLMPAEYDGYAVAPVAQLADAVRRVALVAERNTPVQLTFGDGGTVTVEAGRGEDAQGVDEVDGATLTGEPIMQRFNPQFLLDGLAGLATPYARFSFTGPLKPAVITGQVEPDGGDDDTYRYLVMPVRLP